MRKHIGFLLMAMLMASGFMQAKTVSGAEGLIRDNIEITQLVLKWGFLRDQGKWKDVRETFHPEGTIFVTWFKGPFTGFIEASKKLAEGGPWSKHIISAPVVKVSGDRAISECNATILARGKAGPFTLDVRSYIRFYDWIEKRDGTWRILKRTAIYERDRIDILEPSFLFWVVSLFSDFENHPEPYRYLAYGLEKAGLPLQKGIVTDKSEEMRLLYQQGESWLLADD